jgi:hypothetical protein
MLLEPPFPAPRLVATPPPPTVKLHVSLLSSDVSVRDKTASPSGRSSSRNETAAATSCHYCAMNRFITYSSIKRNGAATTENQNSVTIVRALRIITTANRKQTCRSWNARERTKHLSILITLNNIPVEKYKKRLLKRLASNYIVQKIYKSHCTRLSDSK